MGTLRKGRRTAARSRRHDDVGQREPNILALCTAHFGGIQPQSATPRKPAHHGPLKQTRREERDQQPKKKKKTTTTTTTTATRGPLRDPQTAVSSREIALTWRAEYPARCCGRRRTPGSPPKARARALGFHFAVGPGVAGIGSWLGAANPSPLAQQFAGAGLLAALQGQGSGGDAAPPSRYHPRPLRYTSPTPRPAATPALSSGEARPLKLLAAFDEQPAPAHVGGGPLTPELAALLDAVLSDNGSSNGSSLPDLVPDDTGSDDEAEAHPHNMMPKPPARPKISVYTTPAPAARSQQHEPMTPTSPSPVLEVYEMDVDRETDAQRASCEEAPRAKKPADWTRPPKPAVLCTPVRKRAAKPAFGLMTPPPSAGRL